MSDRIRILLVDDEEDHIELSRRALVDSSLSIELSVANSLAEARAYLAEYTPDLMVVDYRLPDGEGMALLPGSVEKRTMPIVMLTGHGDETIAAEAIKAGALDYIVKTDETLADLPHIIDHALREWQHIVDLRQGKEERMKIQALMNQTTDAVFMCDGKGTVQYINRAIEALAGRKASEIRGKSMHKLFDKDCQSLVMENCEAVLGGESKAFELAFKSTGILCEYKIEPYRDETGHIIGILGGVRDISERNMAEQKIRESEERYRTVVEQSFDGIIVLNEQGKVVFVNAASVAIWGGGASEIIGRPFSDFVHPDEIDRVALYFKQRMAGAGPEGVYDTRFIRKNGEIALVELAGHKASYQGQPADMLSVRDVTERKQAELALVSSEEAFRATFNQAAVGIAHVGVDGHWLKVNDKLCDIVGYSKDELMQLTFQDITHPDDLDLDLRHVQEMLDGKIHTYSMEKRYFQKSGQVVWINLTVSLVRKADGSADYFISVIEDVSERKQAEEALRTSNARLAYAMQGADDGLWDWNLETNEVYYSPRWKAMLGYKEDELGDTLDVWAELVDPAQKDEVLTHAQAYIDGKSPRFEVEFRMRHKDGHWVDILARARLATDADGKPLTPRRLVGTHVDISEFKRLEAEILAEKNQAQTYLDIAGVMMTALDTTGSISLINNKGCEILGYDEQEIIGRNWFDLCLADDVRQEVQGVFKQLMAGELAPVEYYENPILKKSGEERTLAFHNSILKDANGSITGILSSGEDITERKHTEEAFQTIFESTVKPIEQDFFTGIVGRLCDWLGADCAIVSEIVSEGHVRALAMQLDGKAIEHYEYDLADTPCGESDGMGFCAYAEGVCEAFPNDKELIDMKAEGYFGVSLRDESGKSIGILCVISRKKLHLPPQVQQVFEIIAARAAAEIERGQIERELKQAHHYLEGAQRIAHLASWQMDAASGEVIWSEELYAMLGINPELPPPGFDDSAKLFTAESWKSLSDGIAHTLESGEPYDMEIEFIRGDGAHGWMFAKGEALRDKVGAIVGVHGVAMDISKERQQRRLLEARLTLAEASSSEGLHSLMQTTLDLAESLSSSTIGFFHFVSDDQITIDLQAWSTNTIKNMCNAEGEGQHYPIDEAGVWADAVRQKKAVIYNDYANMPGKKGMPEGHATVTRLISVPVFRGDRVVAVIGVGNKVQAYGAADVEIVRELANLMWDKVQIYRGEKMLEESEATFRGLAETLQMAIYISTGEEQVCEYMNPRFTELFGYTMDEIPSVREWWPLAYPDETYRQKLADEWQARVKKAIETESAIEPMEAVVTCKDGSKKTISWGHITLGKTNYAIGVDLTAQKQIEHDLKERFDEIERMNRLMIGRELKMGELRHEIKRLKEEAK